MKKRPRLFLVERILRGVGKPGIPDSIMACESASSEMDLKGNTS